MGLLDTKLLQGDGSELRKQYPGLYGLLGGLLGTAPDEMQGSVLDPNTAAVRQGAELGFPVGTLAQLSPLAGMFARSGAIKSAAQNVTNGANSAKMSAGLLTPAAPNLRGFELDYPKPITEPQGSALRFSIEGAPLTAPLIAGRRVVAGVDEALQRGEAAYAAAGLGVTPQAVGSSALGRSTAGNFRPMFSDSGRFQGPREIKVLDSLNPQDANQVVGHEFGHLLDDIIAGNDGVKAKGTSKELDELYSALNKKLNGNKLWRPQDDGYKGADIAKEKWAEAFRAYQEDPNFIKTIAPNVAKEIRQRVNTHPEISKVIQFNSAAGAGLLGSYSPGDN